MLASICLSSIESHHDPDEIKVSVNDPYFFYHPNWVGDNDLICKSMYYFIKSVDQGK